MNDKKVDQGIDSLAGTLTYQLKYQLKWMLWVLMIVCSAFSGAAMAQQRVLILATDNVGLTAVQTTDFVNGVTNAQNEFAAVVGAANVTTLSILNTPGAVTASTFTDAPGPYDVVITMAAYKSIDTGNWAQINAAIQNKLAKSFIMFNDGCCATNVVALMRDTINSATGFSVALGPPRGIIFDSPLNTSIPVSASFAGLDPLKLGVTTDLNDVPAANALYLAPGAVIPPVGDPLDNVSGVFVPESQSYAGAGACLFGVVDASLLTSVAPVYPANQGKIAPAFLDAVNNSCTAGGLRVTVSLLNAPVEGVAGDYEFSVNCETPTATYPATVTLALNQLANSVSVPVPSGSTNCTVSQTSRPTAPAGSSWLAPDYTQPPNPVPVLGATAEIRNEIRASNANLSPIPVANWLSLLVLVVLSALSVYGLRYWLRISSS
ncbi:hypothetical protein [Ostreibacterium oceani]|uniref:Uncharacterized protein n=1 Tax=Ostreibacterium oceani TaxID=2654998 RepID=A0A6N7F0P8_9GAMM|nr:hypothetical protein [Ostreibacterium oceani]MPV86358.1 hypothetical protein [Ostreibacterium oceani]